MADPFRDLMQGLLGALAVGPAGAMVETAQRALQAGGAVPGALQPFSGGGPSTGELHPLRSGPLAGPVTAGLEPLANVAPVFGGGGFQLSSGPFGGGGLGTLQPFGWASTLGTVIPQIQVGASDRGREVGTFGGTIRPTFGQTKDSVDAMNKAISEERKAARGQTTAGQASPGSTGGAGAFSALAPISGLISQTAAETGVPEHVWAAAIMAESGGNPRAVNAGSGARGILQHIPSIWAPQNPAALDDPAHSLQIARRRFTDAWNDETGGRRYGWNMDDPVERATYAIARAQAYEAYPGAPGGQQGIGFQVPQATPNARVRGYVQEALAAAETPAQAQTAGQASLAPPGTGAVAQRVLAQAQDWVQAAPVYRMVGNATTRQAADCSGFIVGVFNELGLPFAPGVRTAEQIRGATARVAPDAAQPGDLIFFQNTYPSGERSAAGDGRVATHVGIVTENGVMLDTGGPEGTRSLGAHRYDTATWQAKFLEIRRPVQYGR